MTMEGRTPGDRTDGLAHGGALAPARALVGAATAAALALAALAAAPLGQVGSLEAQEARPAPLDPESFAGLGWLEGRWVGSGGGFDAFYEAYRFVNDSTLEQTTYPDDSFAEPDGRSEIRLRDGRALKYRNGKAESMIARVAGDTVRFERVPPRRGGFTWIRESDDAWTAVLDRPRGEPIVYTLRRIE